MKNLTQCILFTLLVVAVYVRLYGLANPIADWHSWRQADTAAVARNFTKFGFDPLRPRFDDLSNIPSGKDNPMGWRMVEFPLYQSVAYGLWVIFPNVPIETVLRLVTIAASVGTLALLYLLMASTMGTFTALFGALIYAVLPYSVYYGRTILPEPFMVFWAVLSVFLVFKAMDKKNWLFIILAGVAAALALLVKPMALLLLLPVPYLFWRRFGLSLHLFIGLLVYWIIGLLPLAVWRHWILQFPEGIPAYAWLLNGNGIRFKGAWFYWLFAERLGKLFLGYWGVLPFGIGLLRSIHPKEGWLFRWLLVGSLLYLVVIATGNVQHDYYQILLLPIVAVYVAKGITYLCRKNAFSRSASLAVAVASVVFMGMFSWYFIRTYYWINRPDIVEAGRTADALLPKNARVIAPYNGDTSFLYQTNRQGWPIGFDIDKKIRMGATHYVTVSPSDADFETRDLARVYTVVVRNDRFAIIDLTKRSQ